MLDFNSINRKIWCLIQRKALKREEASYFLLINWLIYKVIDIYSLLFFIFQM